MDRLALRYMRPHRYIIKNRLGAAADDLIHLNQLEDRSTTEAELEPNLGASAVYANRFYH